MKPSVRLNQFKTHVDSTSAFLSGFRYETVYFTHWPQQDHKKLSNIVSTHIKLILQESGNSELTAQDARFEFRPGSCVLIPPYKVYSAQTHQDVDSFEIFFNVYPITREQEFLGQLGLSEIRHFTDVLTSADFDLLRSCYAAMQEKREGAYAQLHACLTLLLARIVQAQHVGALHSTVSPKEHAVIEKLFAYLDAHLSESIRVEDVCQELQISQSYLYRCSRDVMNCSTNQLITRHKMKYAQTLLRNPDMTISEIAESIGYDPFYFSNQFKKSFMVSPSEYRNKLGKE